MLETLARENPDAAWEKVRDLLRERMSYAAYEQRLKPVRFVSLEGSQMTLEAEDEFSAAWLSERATALAQTAVIGVFNRTDIRVRFVAPGLKVTPAKQAASATEKTPSMPAFPKARLGSAGTSNAHLNPSPVPTSHSAPISDPIPPVIETCSASHPPDGGVQLTEARLSLRDLFVKQNREIPIPGYFRRWIPYLGPTLAWMVVAFRQIFYLHAGNHPKAEIPFPATSDEISRWSGLARSTFWENIKDPRLAWFVVQIPQTMRWKPDTATGQPRQKPNIYRFTASMPLTPGDAHALNAWLIDHNVRGDPVAALELAIQTPAGEILPPTPPPPSPESLTQIPMPLGVQDVVQQAAGRLPRHKFGEVQKLADRLEAHLMPRNDLIFVTWYFLLNWAPKLGGGPAWLVTLLRDRCFFSRGDAPSRRVVRLHGGAQEAADMLGFNRPKTISEWLPPLSERPAWESAGRTADAQRARRKAATRDLTGRFLARQEGNPVGTWQFQVAPYGEEPLIEEHQFAYDCLLDWVGAYLESGERGELDLLLTEMTQERARRARIGLSQPPTTARSGLSSISSGTRSGLSASPAGRDADSLSGDEGRVPDSDADADGREGDSLLENTGAFWTEDKARFRLVLKQILNTFTTAETLEAVIDHLAKNTPSAPAESVWRDESVAADDHWHLASLLERAKIGARRKLIDIDASPKAFVSLLCYASAPEGAGIKDWRGYAAAALLEEPQAGAGGIFDRLAELAPKDLAGLLRKALAQPYTISLTGDRLFDEAFRGAERARISGLADILGVRLTEVSGLEDDIEDNEPQDGG